jgi:hypothetical protein
MHPSSFLAQISSSSSPSPTLGGSKSQKKISTCHREIQHHKMCGKFIAKNRYAYDARYDCPSTWPVWPTNVFFTATPPVVTKMRSRSSSVCSSSSSSSTSSTNMPSSVEYSSERSDDDDSRDFFSEQPPLKRLRASPVSSTLSSTDLEDNLTELDCEILSQFFDFTPDSNYSPL